MPRKLKHKNVHVELYEVGGFKHIDYFPIPRETFETLFPPETPEYQDLQSDGLSSYPGLSFLGRISLLPHQSIDIERRIEPYTHMLRNDELFLVFSLGQRRKNLQRQSLERLLALHDEYYGAVGIISLLFGPCITPYKAGAPTPSSNQY